MTGGLLVDPLDVDALAAALEDAIGPRHDELAKAALERSEQYTWAKAAATHRRGLPFGGVVTTHRRREPALARARRRRRQRGLRDRLA